MSNTNSVSCVLFSRGVEGLDSSDVIFVETYQKNLQERREYKGELVIITECYTIELELLIKLNICIDVMGKHTLYLNTYLVNCR